MAKEGVIITKRGSTSVDVPSGHLSKNRRPRENIAINLRSPGYAEVWNRLTLEFDQASLAHAPEWFTVIEKAYGHTPIYLQADEDQGQHGILPAFLTRSRLFGSVLTSMPFLDTGGPCSSSAHLSKQLMNALIERGRTLGVKWVEFRCTEKFDLPVMPATEKIGLILSLARDPDVLWRSLGAKVRNQVRKAQRSEMSYQLGGAELLSEFYDVFVVNMRDLGSPVHSIKFFAAVLDAFGARARIAIVRKGNTPVGGLLAIAFKNTFTVPWASSLGQYRSLCPNMLLYWETIQAACQEGFSRFDFGRSARDSGTARFKLQWGAVERPLYWYLISTNGRPSRPISKSDIQGALLIHLWKYLPIRMTRWLGPKIRRCLPQ